MGKFLKIVLIVIIVIVAIYFVAAIPASLEGYVWNPFISTTMMWKKGDGNYWWGKVPYCFGTQATCYRTCSEDISYIPVCGPVDNNRNGVIMLNNMGQKVMCNSSSCSPSGGLQ